MTIPVKANADYVYCLLNGQRMTFSQLSSLTHLGMTDLSNALNRLRSEHELYEYRENGMNFFELKYGFQL